MSVDHYENFPVASVLLPKALRHPVGVIYRFARGADDVADEGELSDAARLAGLDAYRQGLDALAAGTLPDTHRALFAELGDVVRAHALPLDPFYALLSAFAQDVTTTRYADDAALFDYCRRSADPVGHLMLHLFKAATPENLAQSDAICTALQLVNFWQDVAIDWQKGAQGRVYLPLEDLRRHGVSEAGIAAGTLDDAWRALLGAKVRQTRALMLTGAPLATRMPGRFGLELCCVVQGGLRILERIEQANYDVFRQRPVLGARDWAVVGTRALRMRVGWWRAPRDAGAAATGRPR